MPPLLLFPLPKVAAAVAVLREVAADMGLRVWSYDELPVPLTSHFDVRTARADASVALPVIHLGITADQSALRLLPRMASYEGGYLAIWGYNGAWERELASRGIREIRLARRSPRTWDAYGKRDPQAHLAEYEPPLLNQSAWLSILAQIAPS